MNAEQEEMFDREQPCPISPTRLGRVRLALETLESAEATYAEDRRLIGHKEAAKRLRRYLRSRMPREWRGHRIGDSNPQAMAWSLRGFRDLLTRELHTEERRRLR